MDLTSDHHIRSATPEQWRDRGSSADGYPMP